MIKRRDFLTLAMQSAIASYSLPVIAANKNKQLYHNEEVNIGYLPITDATALLVAHGMGFFAEEGLKANKPTLVRSWSSLTEGFIAKKFNVVHLLKPIPIWMRYHSKVPIKIVAWAHTNGSALLLGKDNKAKSFKELGSQTIAVPYWYSMHNVVLQMGLRQAGLTPVIKSNNEIVADNEVNLLVLPPPEMPSALIAKKIDGYIVAEPFNALGELKAKARILRFTGDMWKNHPCCVVTMHENDLDMHSDWSQHVVNAIAKAQLYISDNRKEVAKFLSKDGKKYLPFNNNVIERAINYYDSEEYTLNGANRNRADWQNNRIDFEPWPYPSATKSIIKNMRKTVVSGDNSFLTNLDENFVANDLVDYRFITKFFQDSQYKGKDFNRKEHFDLA